LAPPGGGLARVASWSRFRSSRIPIHIRDVEIRLIASVFFPLEGD
jgi:hypothetical protein